LEDSDVSDPKTGKKIRISTTVRLMYRKSYPEEYGAMRNMRLNIAIAKDFSNNAGNILHYFRLGTGGAGSAHQGTAEIRGTSKSFFISAIRGASIDILTIQNAWLKPKYKGSRDKPMELGDE